MKLRCRTCGCPLGLVHHTYLQWDGRWWRKLRFDKQSCLDSFLKKKAEDMERKKAVGMLYSRPP